MAHTKLGCSEEALASDLYDHPTESAHAFGPSRRFVALHQFGSNWGKVDIPVRPRCLVISPIVTIFRLSTHMVGSRRAGQREGRRARLDRPQFQAAESKDHHHRLPKEFRLSVNTDEAHRRAEALFKKEQQQREAQQAMVEYQAGLHAMREKTARLRALRLARDAANPNNPKKPAKQKGAA
jgi:hypothetical protein